MRINQTIFVSFLLISTQLHADITNLVKGVSVNDDTLTELPTTTTPNAFAYGISWLSQRSVNGGTVDAFIKVDDSTNLYSISSELNIYLTNFDTRAYLGHWLITR